MACHRGCQADGQTNKIQLQSRFEFVMNILRSLLKYYHAVQITKTEM